MVSTSGGRPTVTLQPPAKFLNNVSNVLLSYLVKSLIECPRVVVVRECFSKVTKKKCDIILRRLRGAVSAPQ